MTERPTAEAKPKQTPAAAQAMTTHIPAIGGFWAGPVAWLRRPRRKRKGRVMFSIAVGWIALLMLLAIFADFIPGLPHYSERIGDFAQPPDPSSLGTLLGTDGIGRSVLSRVIYGAQVSFTLAFVATAMGLVIGVTIGLLAGYYRGWLEGFSTILANAMAALPGLLFILALVTAVGASIWPITIALGILIADGYIRVVKATTISAASRDYVLAAKALGASDARIIIRELLPATLPVLSALIPITMSILIVVEGGLSFLGYGIPAPTPSWGGMIAAAADTIRRFPIVLVGPVATLFLTVFAFNTIGDYLSARADVREGQL